MKPTRGVADAAFNGFTPPTPRVIAYASDGGSRFAGGVGGAADLKLPALRYQGSDGTLLVTAIPGRPPGQPYSQSRVKSRSFFSGYDKPVNKHTVEFFPFLGIPEAKTTIIQKHMKIN